MEKLDLNFWKGKRVFITGHTGFKGSWLCLLLNYLGAELVGYSNGIPTNPSLYTSAGVSSFVKEHHLDISHFEPVRSAFSKESADILIHLAAQSLVKESYMNPILTLQTNIMGTAHILEAAKNCKQLKSILIVTSDKVYKEHFIEKAFIESDPLGGSDPYSASKSCADIISEGYYKSFFRKTDKNLFVVRSGNVIGGGDWADNRLLPDIIHALKNQTTLQLRNPAAIRPWQHVLEPLFAYLLLIQKTYFGEGQFGQWNIGPSAADHIDVKSLVQKVLSFATSKIDVRIQQESFSEMPHLLINSDKFSKNFQWYPSWSIDKSIQKTIYWYEAFLKGESALDLCLNQIKEYQNA